jgi:hypothetical protein
MGGMSGVLGVLEVLEVGDGSYRNIVVVVGVGVRKIAWLCRTRVWACWERERGVFLLHKVYISYTYFYDSLLFIGGD